MIILWIFTRNEICTSAVKEDMFKGILILCIILYLLSKVGSLFYRAGISSQQRKYQQPTSHQTEPDKSKRSGTIKGGEYIDYEEVK